MPNAGQPTISQGATGDPVRRLQRALRRTPNLEVAVAGIVAGIVDDQTWAVSLHAARATLETAVGIEHVLP